MNVIKVFVAVILFSFVQDAPFKPSNEFEAAVDLQFKTRPAKDQASYDANGNKFEQRSGLLPFLSVNMSGIKANNGEVRFKAIDSNRRQIVSKKLSPNTSYRFDFGFIEDVKKGEVANSITIYFLSDKKIEINRIVLAVTKEGDFLVNGEKRGQF